MVEVGRVGSGVIVVLMGTAPDMLTREQGAAQGQVPEMDFRAYGIGAQILADLGVHDMTLLTNAHRNVVGLDGYGINIVGERPIPEA
jgi:3,4-dihydroxy 2-butanone 4-phosphate synthase / GTP cyclohydrolase II